MFKVFYIHECVYKRITNDQIHRRSCYYRGLYYFDAYQKKARVGEGREILSNRSLKRHLRLLSHADTHSLLLSCSRQVFNQFRLRYIHSSATLRYPIHIFATCPFKDSRGNNTFESTTNKPIHDDND